MSLSYYLDQYGLFGDAQVTCVKLLWDYGFYWSFPALWFYHDKWTDLEFQAQAAEEYRRATELNAQMQKLFARWHQLDGREWHNSFVTLFPWLAQISDELDDELDDETLLAKAKRDLAALEGFAVTVFEKAARSLDGVDVDRRTPVNPYAVSLEPERWEQDGLHSGGRHRPARRPQARERPAVRVAGRVRRRHRQRDSSRADDLTNTVREKRWKPAGHLSSSSNRFAYRSPATTSSCSAGGSPGSRSRCT